MGVNKCNVLVSGIIFIICFVTVWQFVSFLSSHNNSDFNKYKATELDGGLKNGEQSEEKDELTSIRKNYYPVLKNMFLLLLFVCQHTGMCSTSFTSFLLKHGITVLQRTLYIAMTCLVLQILMKCWSPVYHDPLWKINTKESSLWWWAFTLAHTFSWTVIYGGCLVMDLGEMVGVKQVYYDSQGLQNPLSFKSEGLRRLYRHMRHPSLSALIIILWFHPVMCLDRLLLAVTLPLYMLMTFKVDTSDHLYHKKQIQRKELEFKYSYCYAS